jgi:hypothetical protein
LAVVTSAAVPETSHRNRPAGWLGPALAVALTCLGTIEALRLWTWRPGAPFALDRDAPFVVMEVRDLIDHGWYWSNDNLGAPFAQNGSLFPEANVIHLVAVKALTVFSSDAFTVTGGYFVLCFPLTAATMYWFMRTERIGRLGSVVGAVLLALAPGHQTRFDHLWLAATWVVPLSLWLVMTIGRGRPLLGPGAGRWRSWPTWRTVLIVVVVGSSGVYYAGYTLLLLVAAAALARLGGDRNAVRRGLLLSMALGTVTLAPLLAARLGTAGELVTGRLPAVRPFGESEIFAGKLTDLVLPWAGHRLDALAYLTSAYNAAVTPTFEESALGIVAVGGIVALAVAGIAALATGHRPGATLRPWAALTAVAFGLYTLGGLGSLVALFATPQLRTWSRWWIYLMAFGLLAVGHLLGRLATRRRRLTLAIGGALVLIGWLDQTNPAVAPDYHALRERVAALRSYATTIDAATGPDCPVFQLPVTQFPEPPERPAMGGYEQLLPYLSAGADLHWSAGAMSGTAAADWQQALPADRPADLVRDLAALGFCAIEVDEDGYRDADGAVSGAAPTAGLRAILGEPVAGIPAESLVTFALRGRPDDTIRDQVLRPVLVSVDGYQASRVDGRTEQRVAPSAALRVANLGQVPVRGLAIDLVLVPRGPAEREVVVRDGEREVARTTLRPGSEATLRVVLDAPRGLTRLGITVSGEPVETRDPRALVTADLVDLRARVADPAIRVVPILRPVAG